MKSDHYRRFEEFMKVELAQQKELVSSYRKEMQDLRELVYGIKDKCESLANQNKAELQTRCSYIENRINELDQATRINRISLIDLNTSVKNIFGTLNEYDFIYAKKIDMQSFIKEISDKINQAIERHSTSAEVSKHQLNETTSLLLEKIRSLKEDIKSHSSSLGFDLNEKLSIYQMDKDGVLAEVRRYRKDVFIMQKKVENLYTQIDRINKRSQECPKQV